MNFSGKVWALCRKVPKGRVTTYGEIARALGSGARAVGNALNKNPYIAWEQTGRLSCRRQDIVPCHRVVKSDGEVGGFAHGISKTEKMLGSEGITIQNGKIKDFRNCFYRIK